MAALFLFMRGIHAPGAGCHVIDADLEVLDALDTAMAAALEPA